MDRKELARAVTNLMDQTTMLAVLDALSDWLNDNAKWYERSPQYDASGATRAEYEAKRDIIQRAASEYAQISR